MKIALLGYGKMGKSIEEIALNRGHDIVLKTNTTTDVSKLAPFDVAIDFSLPSAAYNNIITALDAGIPIISGTTGWLEKYTDVVDYCKKKNGSFLYASNFSLGVNVFFELNRKLSQLMSDIKSYEVSIIETHHTQKLDAPSGTAITLAEGIIQNSHYTNWKLDKAVSKDEIFILSKRIDDIPGTHEITYRSEVDSINITHTAHNRKGFALGAVIAAEWIKDKNGIFTMKDVLNIG